MTLAYDENGRLLTTKTPDGTVESNTYNVAGQLIQKKIAYKDNVVTHKYSYDETYKTISESAEIQNESLYPELNGTGNFNDAVMSYGNGNRLETYNEKTLTYDNDGNMTKAPLDGTMTEYVYDKYNNLISVGTTHYSYDAEGTRISQTDNGNTTTYITNKNASLSQLLVKQNSDGTETSYVYGLGLISQETKAGATYSNYRAYQFDNRGSALTLTNQSGEITDRFFFDPYGELIGRHGNTDTIFMYVGKYGVQTDNNGLLYMRARYYNTDIKRFVNVDPIRDGLNWYGYVEGNPIDYIDPDGLDAIWLNGSNWIPIAGHSSLLIQDAEGNWYYSYFAADAIILEPVQSKTIYYNTPDEPRVSEILPNGAELYDIVNPLESLDNFNHSIHVINAKHPNWQYDSATYIKGDFSKSYEYLKWLQSGMGEDSTKNPFYRVLAFNCAHASLTALSFGVLEDGTNVGDFMRVSGIAIENQILPNDITKWIQLIFGNQSFTKEEAEREIRTNIQKLEDFLRLKNQKSAKVTSDSLRLTLYRKLLENYRK